MHKAWNSVLQNVEYLRIVWGLKVCCYLKSAYPSHPYTGSTTEQGQYIEFLAPEILHRIGTTTYDCMAIS